MQIKASDIQKPTSPKVINPTIFGILLAASSALFFGIGAPVTKALASVDMTALQITQARMTVAALLLLFIYPKQLLVPRSPFLSKNNRKRRSLHKRATDLKLVIYLCTAKMMVVSLVVYMVILPK